VKTLKANHEKLFEVEQSMKQLEKDLHKKMFQLGQYQKRLLEILSGEHVTKKKDLAGVSELVRKSSEVQCWKLEAEHAEEIKVTIYQDINITIDCEKLQRKKWMPC
jgi:hypothetical protein